MTTVETHRRENNLNNITEKHSDMSNDSSILEIINNVETHLVQESIQEQWKKHDEVKMRLKDFTILIISLLSFVIPFSVILSNLSSIEQNSILSSIFVSIMALGFFFLPAGIVQATTARDTKKREKNSKIKSLRIELAEKMLNIEILKKENVKITEEWDEVMALDKNGDYVKILIRIVKNQETGLETIESKMLKNQ